MADKWHDLLQAAMDSHACNTLRELSLPRLLPPTSILAFLEYSYYLPICTTYSSSTLPRYWLEHETVSLGSDERPPLIHHPLLLSRFH